MGYIGYNIKIGFIVSGAFLYPKNVAVIIFSPIYGDYIPLIFEIITPIIKNFNMEVINYYDSI